MKRISILGVNITAVNMRFAIEVLKEHIADARGKYICVANVHTTVYAYEHIDYKDVQNNSYMTLPDGKPLSIVGKIKGYREMDRVTGPEFLENILEISKEKNWKHYFYGNTKENMDILVEYLRKKYPELEIAGYEPSVFRPLTSMEEKELISRINDSSADFVWVGIGAPKQEILCARLSKDTKAVWVGVGGAFNVLPGIIPRAPRWMQKCCLEWFYRMMKEPRRLFKRYFITNSKFIYYLIKKRG